MFDWLRSFQLNKKEADKAKIGKMAYVNYFKDFTIHRKKNLDGKGSKTIRVYEGDYYYQDIPNKKWIVYRILFPLMFMGSLTIFTILLLSREPGNSMWYVILSQIISLLSYFYLLYVLIGYITSPRKMTVGCFNATSKPIIFSAKLNSFCLVLAAIVRMIYLIINDDGDIMNNIYIISLLIMSATLSFLIGFFESKINYIIIRSKKLQSEAN